MVFANLMPFLALLVWQLAFNKANNPKQFWKSTLKNIKTCCKKWVHPYEASRYGIYSSVCVEKSVFNKKKHIYSNSEISQYENIWNLEYKKNQFLPWVFYDKKR